MKFVERIRTAEQATRFAKVLARHPDGRVAEVLVPGSAGRQYRVALAHRTGQVVVDCRLGTPDGPVCAGLVRGVCYHALAALMLASETPLRFSDAHGDWRRWREDGREVRVVDSAHGGRIVFTTPEAETDRAPADLPPGGVVILDDAVRGRADRARRALYGDEP